MYISKQDALRWFEFFAELPEDESLLPRQQEIALAAMAQIEAAENARTAKLMADIPGLKSLEGRTYYVGDDARTVDVTVRRLREKIEDDPANPVYILTRRGVGYYYSGKA